MESSERIDTMRERMTRDMETTLRRNGMDVADETWLSILISELVDDGMFYVEKVIDGD